MRTVLTVLVIALLVVVSVSGLRATGESDILFVSSGSAEVGDETTVTLGVAKTVDPPNGAWTIDITYDNRIVSAVSCEALSGSVCSPAFTNDTFRSTGASAAGIEAPMDFARLTFRCEEAGESPFSMSVSVWFDATGMSFEELELDEGSITCTQPTDLITISSLDLAVGEQGIVFVEAERVAQPGVGAWGVELIFDLAIAALTSCNALGERSLCAGDPQQSFAQGFEADGLLSGTVLAEFSFRCRQPGEFEIGAFVSIWSVAGVGLDERPVEVEPGRITCGASQLPSTGTAAPQPTSPPAAVPLALLGAVLLAAALAFRRYAPSR